MPSRGLAFAARGRAAYVELLSADARQGQRVVLRTVVACPCLAPESIFIHESRVIILRATRAGAFAKNVQPAAARERVRGFTIIARPVVAAVAVLVAKARVVATSRLRKRPAGSNVPLRGHIPLVSVARLREDPLIPVRAIALQVQTKVVVAFTCS
jgi:hypothetical protein